MGPGRGKRFNSNLLYKNIICRPTWWHFSRTFILTNIHLMRLNLILGRQQSKRTSTKKLGENSRPFHEDHTGRIGNFVSFQFPPPPFFFLGFFLIFCYFVFRWGGEGGGCLLAREVDVSGCQLASNVAERILLWSLLDAPYILRSRWWIVITVMCLALND